MQFRLAMFVILSLVSVVTIAVRADDGVAATPNYATVKLYFINRWLQEPNAAPIGPAVTPGGMGGGMGGGSMQRQFETASLYLNDNFVGHIMFRQIDVTPKLNLSPGEHRFRIECDGYAKFERTLTVLNNGSLQWLVVKLERPASSKEADPKTTSKN